MRTSTLGFSDETLVCALDLSVGLRDPTLGFHFLDPDLRVVPGTLTRSSGFLGSPQWSGKEEQRGNGRAALFSVAKARELGPKLVVEGTQPNSIV